MAQRKRNPGAIRDLESIVNPVTGDINTGTGTITMQGTQIRHPVQFGPYTMTASVVQLITDIASWANEIGLTIINVSTNGASPPILQLWTLTGVVTSGYLGAAVRMANATASSVSVENHSNGFKVSVDHSAARVFSGNITLRRHGTATSNTWVFSHNFGRSDSAAILSGGGHIVLPGALVKLSFGTVTGTDVYDSGEVAGFYRY